MRPIRWLAALPLLTTFAAPTATAQGTALSLWKSGAPAFGMFVPSERAPGATDATGRRLPPLYTADGAKALAANALLDYLFLNLEGAYDADAVRAMVAGLKAGSGTKRPTLLVRIPTIEAAGADSTRARVKQVLALGADGVVIPHVRSAEEARLAAGFFKDAGANVWSPATPNGTVVAMLMIEDTGAVAVMQDIAAVPGYSLLSCGIGSLTRDMGGDAPGAETACKQVRDVGAKVGMPSMMTAAASTIRDRLDKGYLGLLMSGSAEQASAVIRVGHEIIGRR
jgi:2-keto-3-deoxy-L-rhamnonate aldolase RhmA